MASFEIRTVVFIVPTITVVSMPGGVSVVSGIGISVAVCYRGRLSIFLIDDRSRRRSTIDPGGGNSESYVSIYIYL
jgi:hypothetical protein